MAFLCVNTPHIDVFVKKEYLYDLQKGHGELVEGVWVTAKSIQGRALYFETYIPEYGALFDKLPISAFVWKKDIKESIPLTELQLWDCFSYDICITEKQMLSGNQVKYLSPKKKWYHGWYMFTIDNANATNLERNVILVTFIFQFAIFSIIQIFEINSVNFNFKKKVK